MEDTQIFITIVCSFIASSGFWALIQSRLSKNDSKSRMLVGLGHDRIIELGMIYIRRGCITQDEYENLVEYLYEPYKKLGGNGTAKRVIEEIDKLPIVSNEVVNHIEETKHER